MKVSRLNDRIDAAITILDRLEWVHSIVFMHANVNRIKQTLKDVRIYINREHGD